MKTKYALPAAFAAAVCGYGGAASAQDLSFNITPGTSLTFYGFVRAEAFYDFDFDQGDLSLTSELDSLNPTDGAFNTSVRVSRFGFRLKSQTDGGGELGGQLEYDLFGSGGTAELRLRHANITYNGWTFGQDWTNFMPLVHYPNSADFNGPVGVTFARVPQVRYSGKTGNLDYSFSIEEGTGNSEDPIVTAAALYNGDNYSARIAALYGTVSDDVGEDSRSGFTLSGTASPWEGGTVGFTFVDGNGIGSYLIGGGSNLVAGQANGVTGGTLEVRQKIGDKWDVGIAYGFEDYDSPGARDISELSTVHVNAFYSPRDNLTFGLEYIYGERTAGDGSTLDANRLGASVTFRF